MPAAWTTAHGYLVGSVPQLLSARPGGERGAALVRLGEKERRCASSPAGRNSASLGCALVGDPELLFLDEPTTGLDPQSRRQAWDIVERLKARGRHGAADHPLHGRGARLCDRVAVVDHGKVIALGTPRELIASLGAEHVVEFAVGGLRRDGDRRMRALAQRREGVRDGGRLAPDRARGAPRRARAARGAGERRPPPTALTTHHATLEDVFMALTGGACVTAEQPTCTVRGPLVELTRARFASSFASRRRSSGCSSFPILLAGILGLAFRASRPPDPLPVGGGRRPARAGAAGGARGRGPGFSRECFRRRRARGAARGAVVL